MQRQHLITALLLVISLQCRADNASKPLGEPVLERPTLHSLGVHWLIAGDDNQNATITFDYRKAGEPTWHPTLPLFRVERNADVMPKFGTKLPVPKGAWLFAASAVLLTPDTPYELRLTLTDPDNPGQRIEKILPARTRAEPTLPPNATWKPVTSATLAAAQSSAKPGDHFLFSPGTYEGTFTVTNSGTEGNPIVYRGSPDGEVILNAQGSAPQRPKVAVLASGVHDVWFENLTVINADWGIVAHESSRIVVRRCHVHHCDYGFTATRNTHDTLSDDFISDNLIEGPCTWPRTKGIEDPRGIQITGAGHVVCYNSVRGFSDAIDTYQSPRCEDIDFHNNECSECTDDGMELDYSQRNVRAFHNRFTNVFQGLSVQPVHGGPVYAFRNAFYNVGLEPFKMHNQPSGALFFHNTVVKAGPPLELRTGAQVHHCVLRNNLFIGTTGPYAYETNARMIDCDFDYDGFGGRFDQFLKWNRTRYPTLDAVRAKSPVEKHATFIDPATAFASGVRPPTHSDTQYPTPPDLRPSPHSPAIDAGTPLPGFNDNYTGKAPDLGAYELNEPLPHYGPRPH